MMTMRVMRGHVAYCVLYVILLKLIMNTVQV